MTISTSFDIKKYSSLTVSTIPDDAIPVGTVSTGINAPPTVIWPQPQGVDGRNRPSAIIGKPWAEFGRPRITATGYTFYNNLFESSTSGSAYIKVKLYNERSQSWESYAGCLWRPMHDQTMIAGSSGPEWTNFRCRVTELITSTW